MTAFKFGKKKKESKNDNNSAFSSPSSQKTVSNTIPNPPVNGSPQTSAYSANSHSNLKSQATPTNSPGVSNSIPPQAAPPQHQQQRNNGYNQTLGYDLNNNIYNPRSPQRGAQQNASPQKYSSEPSQYARNYQQLPQTPSNPQLIPSPWARSKLTISPFPRYRHAASNLANEKGEVFVMGGLHNTSVYGDTWIIKQEPDGKTFQTFQVDMYENSPAPRVGHASTLCGNAYVIFGGDTVTNDAGEIDNDLYLFNMNTHTWTIPHPIGKRPSGRYGHTIGVVAVTNFDSKLYLYGGQLDDIVYDDLAVFNLSSFRRPEVQWEWVTPETRAKPPGLTNHTMDVYDNKLWLFGGSTGQRLSNELWTFDPSKNIWELVKTAGESPQPVEEHASIVYNDLLIVHGGKNYDGEAVDDVNVLNLVTKTWFKLPQHLALEPQGKYGHSLSIIKNNKLLLLGGHLPDFAKLGNDLEPALHDNGVGTIIHTLDLTNITKLIPGLYQYSTPSNVVQDRFSPNETGSSSSNIFTPPATQAQHHQQQQANQTPLTQASYGSPEKGYNSTKPLPRSSGSLSSNNSRQQTSKSSAEEAFQHDYDTSRNFQSQTPPRPLQGTAQSVSLTPPPSSHQSTPIKSQELEVPYSPEEELPLDIPSPIRSQPIQLPIPAPIQKEAGIPTPIAKESTSSKTSPERDEDFETQLTTPVEARVERPIISQDPSSFKHISESYLEGEAKGSDFLDNYVNGNSTASLQERLDEFENQKQYQPSKTVPQSYSESTSVSEVGSVGSAIPSDRKASLRAAELDRKDSLSTIGSDRKDSVISNNAIFGVGSTAAVVGTGLKNVFVGGNNSNQDVDAATRDIPGAFTTAPTNNDVRNPSVSSNTSALRDDGEKQQFKSIIQSLSAELQQLKLSTTEQVKSASSKVSQLELENQELRSKLETTSSRDIAVEDDNDIKRKNIKLSTDYQLLNKDHESLRSRYDEIEPVFQSNLIDLSRLNELIKQQQSEIEVSSQKLKDQEDWKLQFNELKLKYDSLLQKSQEFEENNTRSIQEQSSITSKLTQSIDSFLNKYVHKDEETGEVKPRDLGINGNGNGDNTGQISESLRSQIDDLLKENEESSIQNKELLKQVEILESKTSEIDALKTRIAELLRLEDNYKDSLHSVRNSSRALQISQSELSKQREISTKLQAEIDELKIFKANKKSSRNATPVINEFTNRGSDIEEGEEDFENAHYNLKLRDLQAELFIIKQERDELKQDVLNLKKKLLVANTPTSSL